MNATAKRFFTKCAPCEGDGTLSDPREDTGLSAYPASEETTPCEACDDGKALCRACNGEGTIPRRVPKLMMARVVSRLARLRAKLRRLDDPKSTPRASSPRWRVPYHAGAGYLRRYATALDIARLKLIEAGVRKCGACDGEGTRRCEPCDGNGYTWNGCECGASFEDEDTVYVGDGEIICHACAHKRGAFKCEACDGAGEITRTDVECRGKKFPLVGASCSRCGGRPHNPGEPDANGLTGDYPWFVARAPMCDTDGVFYAYLCSSPDGEEGCLGDTLDEQDQVPKSRKELLGVLEGCEPDDLDGMTTDMADLGPLADGLFGDDASEGE